MYHWIVRSCVIAFALCAAVAAFRPGVAQADLSDCITQCQTLVDGIPADAAISSADALARCENEIPACVALDAPSRAALPALCESLRGVRAPRAPRAAPRASSDTYCVMPEGATRDEARARCHCSGSTPFAFRVDREHSGGLPIVGVGRRDEVFVCVDPFALRGAPGSGGERMRAAERAITEAEAGLRALCAPHAGESLSAACAHARTEFLALGSSDGPVDLAPLREAISAIEAVNRRQDEDIDGIREGLNDLRETEANDVRDLREAIEDATRGHDRDGDHEGHGDHHGDSDDEDEASPPPPRETPRETPHEEPSEATHDDPAPVAPAPSRDVTITVLQRENAFVLVQGYGLVGFNPLTYSHHAYGNLWQAGGELTLGVGLGGGWNFHGGIGVAYGGPDISGATNVAGEARLGLGVSIFQELMVGFGLISTHRFLPNVLSASSLYGVYGDAMIRFMPHSDWSPVLTVRVGLGGAPREEGTGWQSQFDGFIQALVGVGHF
ncbi:MAG: hypothetical protein WCK01_00585 [Candidatus Uhrbacteria bacterium]